MPAPDPEKMLKKEFGDDLNDALQRHCVADCSPALRKAAINHIHDHGLIQVARARFALNVDPGRFRFKDHDFYRARAFLRLGAVFDGRTLEPDEDPGSVRLSADYDAARHYRKPLSPTMLLDWTSYVQEAYLKISEHVVLRDYQCRYWNRQSVDGSPDQLGTTFVQRSKRPDQLVHTARAYLPANADATEILCKLAATMDLESSAAEVVILGKDGKDIVTFQQGDEKLFYGHR